LSRNYDELNAIVIHFNYKRLAVFLRQFKQFIIAFIGVLSSWLTDANII
jgi:hypothetical protein